MQSKAKAVGAAAAAVSRGGAAGGGVLIVNSCANSLARVVDVETWKCRLQGVAVKVVVVAEARSKNRVTTGRTTAATVIASLSRIAVVSSSK